MTGPILREISDDDELCESSVDGLFEGSGYAVDGKSTYRIRYWVFEIIFQKMILKSRV